ncbi:MAG: hypothetical protein MJK04_35750, partial [Psychrosphaera sp.]|nr:hypothetical protein [Psychrosphaera sp.]
LMLDDGQEVDLFRDKTGVHIPDVRNDENVLISQLHLLWLKLHNIIVDDPLVGSAKAADKFKIAREVVTSVFKTIVWNDFMYQLLDTEVFKFYGTKFPPVSHIYNEGNPYEQIPLEFAAAGFRFGHSMVRETYRLNEKTPVTISKLLIDNHCKQIEEKHRVEWERFFVSEKVLSDQPASAIDLRFAPSLGKIKEGKKKPTDIVRANFDASIRAKLPSGGQAIAVIRKYKGLAKAARLADINGFEYASVKDSLIEDHWGKDGQTTAELPLWPYVLLETPNNPEENRKGDRLGPLGSIIVAEVLSNAMGKLPNRNDMFYQAAQKIIDKHTLDWKSMFALINFVKHR